MWKISIPALALLLLTANAALAEIKIGIVDMRAVITDSEPGKKMKATLTSKFGAERDKLEKQGKDLQKQAESLKNSSSDSREALEEKRGKFIREKQDLDQKAREFGAKVEKEEMALQNELRAVVMQAAESCAKKLGVNYLVDSGAGILYADQSMDVTKDMMEEVNRIWKENPPKSSSGGSSKSGGGKKK